MPTVVLSDTRRSICPRISSQILRRVRLRTTMIAFFRSLRIALLGVVQLAFCAAARAQLRNVELHSSDTCIAIRFDHAQIIITSLKSASGNELITQESPPPIPLIDFAEIAGKRVPLNWRLVSAEQSQEARDEYVATFVAERPLLKLKSIWRARAGPGPIDRKITITNDGSAEILLPLQTTLSFAARFDPKQRCAQWTVEKGGPI